MKKLIYSLLTLSFFCVLSLPVLGDTNRPVKEILGEIRKEQNLKNDEAVNPEKVSSKLLEELGDAVMDVYHPNKKDHVWMDQMMGGENSKSLKAMHEIMGYRYLQGYSGYGNTPGYMMGGGLGGYGPRGAMMNSYGPGMMGDYNQRPGFFYHQRGFGGFWMWIFLILLIGIALFVFFKMSKKNAVQSESALDILKKRYAKGEINKQEYENIKKDL